jgi:dihydrofolate reductase
MREVVVQMHMTLDGFADSEKGFVPIGDRSYWAGVDRALRGTAASRVDTLLLGKGTYKQFYSFWPKVAEDPSAPKGWRDQGKYLGDTPKIIFSKTLPKAEWRNSTIVRGDISKEIARLKRQPGKNMLVLGGVAFPRALIERDLVDEYLLAVVPILVGGNRDRLFPRLHRQRNLKLVRTWSFPNGVVLHQYRKTR